MKIEAVCEHNGLHPEYLVRCSHKQVMALGAALFKPGEYLGVVDALQSMELALTQLRWTTRAIEVAPSV